MGALSSLRDPAPAEARLAELLPTGLVDWNVDSDDFCLGRLSVEGLRIKRDFTADIALFLGGGRLDWADIFIDKSCGC